MSGILLPGQGKPKPESESKIELPKGYTAPRKEKAVEQPAQPETKPSGEPPAGAPRRSGSRQPGAEMAFPPRGAQIRCPSCSTPYVVPVFTIIDLGANPELRGPLLGGQVNVAVCPNCGAGGALGAPLLVHDPDNQFLGVYMPMEAARDDLQRQRAIGDLTQTLMRKIPSEARRGYMLQPRQFTDWQHFQETLWEFEGVTPEMLRRQREQANLLQRLVNLVGDRKALELALERGAGLVDRDFFSLLDQLTMMSRSQGQGDEHEKLLELRETLLDMTEAGKQVRAQQERVRSILSQITSKTTREELLDIVLNAWKEEDRQQVVGTLVLAAAPLMDYQFLMTLSERVGATTDADQRKELEELRAFILQMQEQVAARQRQEQEVGAQQAQGLLQEILQATDTAAALREHADLIDESFLSLLAANIQAAERNKATAAAKRLRKIYELALGMIQESLPDDLRLLNQLLSAPDEASTRQLLRDNRALLTKDFLDALKPIETEMREGGRAEIADRIRALRGQIALMM